ncbi:unnamed protein product [Ectocarpus sp. CCAP 1310/34]|nr:unnamed protein product [Ectocarpus sp. CCAP 1310/34]
MRFVDDSPRPFTDSPRPVTKDSAAGDAEAASRTSGMIGGARRSFHPGVGGSSSRGGGRASHHRPRQAVARTQQSAPSSGASRPPSSAASTTARPATTVQRPTSGDTDGPGHRGEGGPSRRASDPGKSAAAGGLSSQGRGSFTSSRGRAVGYAYRERAAPATAGGTAVSSSAPPSFTRIGGGSSHTPAGGGGRVSSVAITSDMSGESVYQALVAVGISLLSKAALLGILMSAVAPSHEESRQHVVKSNTRKHEREPVKGERPSNGIVAAIFCVYSYAFVGAAKVQFSGGQKGDETNNVFLAAVSHVWVAARQGDPDWLAIASARATLHGIVREALIPLALGLIQKECLENDPFTLEDIFRSARERARYLEPHMNASTLTGRQHRH